MKAGKQAYIENLSDPTESNELRCECRRLLAKISDGHLELSCPRCKRKVMLDLNKLTENGFVEESILFS